MNEEAVKDHGSSRSKFCVPRPFCWSRCVGNSMASKSARGSLKCVYGKTIPTFVFMISRMKSFLRRVGCKTRDIYEKI